MSLNPDEEQRFNLFFSRHSHGSHGQAASTTGSTNFVPASARTINGEIQIQWPYGRPVGGNGVGVSDRSKRRTAMYWMAFRSGP